eukprot:CAMPEP_0196788324 /NCGR_PEP_ID=MMETSP1104-20130614/24727_1 /TAXON_ID=33652 /ORGANISM="Cafeteria sp., Strain Caron Lab Isolate" /LENGTH=69 /DNA_ID=CAMNT_0042158667 /DNA_START=42 /DNA_END=249 /DNA_ORIENTATION=+
MVTHSTPSPLLFFRPGPSDPVRRLDIKSAAYAARSAASAAPRAVSDSPSVAGLGAQGSPTVFEADAGAE